MKGKNNRGFADVRSRLAVIIALMGALLLSIYLPATSAYADAFLDREEVVFVLGTLGGVHLNPMIGYSYGLYRSVLYTTLFRLDGELEPQPWLAISYEKRDPTTWVVKLRRDARWHDGERVTSEDVKFTLDLIREAGGVMARFVKGIELVEAPDDYTVVVRTERPTLLAPWLTSVYILPKHYWEGSGAVGKRALEFANDPPIGSGPFKLVDWRPGEILEFEAFDGFFMGRPKIDRLVWRIYSSPEPMIAALKTGEIDAAAEVPIKFLRELEKVEGIKTEVVQNSAIYDIYINQAPLEERKGHPALLDINVRRAIFHAIDKEYINEQVYDGRFFPALSVIPKIRSKYFCDECEAIHPKFDLATAAEILEEAGYKDTDGDGIREDPKSGVPLIFRWWTASDRPEGVRIGEIVRGWFREVGMDISEIKIMEGGALWDLITREYDYDLVYWSWSVQDESSILFVFTSYASGPPVFFSSSQYRNPEFDKLYEKQLSALTEEERIDAIKEAQRHLIENAVEFVMVYPGVVSAWWGNKWTGNVPEPTGSFSYGNLNSQMFLYLRPVDSRPVNGAEMETAEPHAPTSSIVAAFLVIALAAVVVSVLLRRRKTRAK